MTVEQKYTLNQRKLQPTIKVVNSLLRLEKKVSFSLLDFSCDSILERARKKTGLNNFGNDNYIEVLDRLIDNVNKINMTPLGEFFIKLVIYRGAINRLKIEDYNEKNPAIKNISIDSPVFVVGFPRTGTTLLQNVLSCGEGYRSLYFWELVTPYPLSGNIKKDQKMRMNRANLMLQLFKLGAPELEIVHDIRINSKEECWILLANTLVLINFDLGTGLHEWNNWLMKMDRSWVYEEYKRLLQIQAHTVKTKKFVLKCPSHLWNIDSILKIFPDACIVWTHRNPADIIASTCSLVGLAKRFFFQSIDYCNIGNSVLNRFSDVVEKAIKFRDRIEDGRFYDVKFDRLIQNTPETVKNIKKYFGLEYNLDHKKEMQEYLKKSKKAKFRKHSYSLEQFYLNKDEVLERFDFYIKKFDL